MTAAAGQLPWSAGQVVAVAAWSARALAEAARRDGWQPLALDLFGDVDTRRASPGWRCIGDAGSLHIDALALRQGLHAAAGQGAVGWIAGSGFDDRPELLDAAGSVLPLLGTPAAAQRRGRDPAVFFAALDRLGLPHPPVAWQVPDDHQAWLIKQADGCGGGHVRAALPGEGALPPRRYAQRRWPGVPMSATFVAAGRHTQLWGFNRQTVAPTPAQPYRFCGAIGPLALPAPAATTVRRFLDALVPALGLVGLGSLDFLLDGDAVAILEVNARPPATLALYAQRRPLAAHLAACLGTALPPCLVADAGAAVHGFETVFASAARPVGPALAAALARQPGLHDLPHAGAMLSAGAPLCSISARAADADAVRAQLDARCAAVHHLLESLPP